jgi:hypothetical protein
MVGVPCATSRAVAVQGASNRPALYLVSKFDYRKAAWPKPEPIWTLPFWQFIFFRYITAKTRLASLGNELFPAEQAGIATGPIEQVDIGTDGLEVRLRMDGLAAFAREMTTDVGAAA